LRYLGYIVDPDGLRPDPEKVEAIVNIPPPRNVTEIRPFIGTASWYRRFLPDFSLVLAPILNLTKKNVKWNWTPECQKSFNKLKECLISAPILTVPDFERTFHLQTDASSYGLGAVLTQFFDGEEKVICYLSRSLTKQEMKLSVREKECLAVIWSVEKLRHYLDHVHFKVYTDHASLLWLHRLKDPLGRLGRWQLRLQQFDFELIHRKGKENIVPDFLSRAMPVPVQSVNFNHLVSPTTDKWYLRLSKSVKENPIKYPLWRVENDILYKFVKPPITNFSPSGDDWKIVIPKDKSRDILYRHNIPAAGHEGIFKTYGKVLQRYYWPKMRADVTAYVKCCNDCAQSKVEQKAPAGLMGTRPEITQPFEALSLDYIGPLPRSKQCHCFILVIMNYFSKAVFLYPCRSAKSKSLVKHVEDFFLLFGAPSYLMCDNEVQMKYKEFQKLCEKYKTRIFYTARYNPRANPVERNNRVVATMLRTYVSQDNHRTWDEHLSEIGCAIRTCAGETTKFSPYYILFGREHKCCYDETSR